MPPQYIYYPAAASWKRAKKVSSKLNQSNSMPLWLRPLDTSWFMMSVGFWHPLSIVIIQLAIREAPFCTLTILSHHPHIRFPLTGRPLFHPPKNSSSNQQKKYGTSMPAQVLISPLNVSQFSIYFHLRCPISHDFHGAIKTTTWWRGQHPLAGPLLRTCGASPSTPPLSRLAMTEGGSLAIGKLCGLQMTMA